MRSFEVEQFTKEYNEGYDAWNNSVPYDCNPYEFFGADESQHKAWVSGWYDAMDDHCDETE